MVEDLIAPCPDVVAANSFEGLMREMNRISNDEVNGTLLRQYRGGRTRTCTFQTILDPGARPLIAVREFILSLKSLGGLQTDLDGRVLRRPDPNGTQNPIPDLYAVGETTDFGDGGIQGLRSLEGIFLGTCILGGVSRDRRLRTGGAPSPTVAPLPIRLPKRNFGRFCRFGRSRIKSQG